MQKSDNNQVVANAHRRVRTSTTLNRKYVRRPETTASVTVRRMTDVKALKNNVNMKMRARSMDIQPSAPKLTAKELKDQAIKKALAAASKTTSPEYVN